MVVALLLRRISARGRSPNPMCKPDRYEYPLIGLAAFAILALLAGLLLLIYALGLTSRSAAQLPLAQARPHAAPTRCTGFESSPASLLVQSDCSD